MTPTLLSTNHSEPSPSRRGPAMMEYVILAVMIAATVVAAAQFFGDTVVNQLELASSAMQGETNTGALPGAGAPPGGGAAQPNGESGDNWSLPGTGESEAKVTLFERNQREFGSERNYELTEGGNIFSRDDWNQTGAQDKEEQWGETVRETTSGDVEDKSWIEQNVDAKATLAEAELEFLDHEGSVIDGKWGNENNKVTAGALGYETDVNAGLNIGKDGVQGELSAEAEAYLLKAEYEGTYGPGYVNAEAAVLAEAGAGAEVNFNPFGGDVSAGAGAEAFAGGKLEASGGVQGGNGKLGGNAGVTYGIGAEAKAEIGLEDGKVKASVDLGATLGVGLDVGLEVEVDVIETAKDAVQIARNIAGWIPRMPWQNDD